MDALTPIQTAFKSTLSADVTLASMVTGIFNDVPTDQLYPYVEIGSGTQRPWHTFHAQGWNCTVTVHIWSRYQGDIQALAILARVIALLDPLSQLDTIAVTGYATVICELDQARVLVEQVDKIETRHVPAVFRVWVS